MSSLFNPREIQFRPAESSTTFCDTCHETVYKQKLTTVGLGKKWDPTVQLFVPLGEIHVCPPCHKEVQREIVRMRRQIAMLAKVRRLAGEGATPAELDTIIQQHGLTPDVIQMLEGVELGDSLYGMKYGS